jgi:hypothetical protein
MRKTLSAIAPIGSAYMIPTTIAEPAAAYTMKKAKARRMMTRTAAKATLGPRLTRVDWAWPRKRSGTRANTSP